MDTEFETMKIIIPLLIFLHLGAAQLSAQTFTILHTFTNSPDGGDPGGLVLNNGVLYGTAGNGGEWGLGTVYRLATNGTDYSNLYSFAPPPNAGFVDAPTNFVGHPGPAIVLGGNTLYGYASGFYGAVNQSPTVYKISTDGRDFEVLAGLGNTYPSSLAFGDGILFVTAGSSQLLAVSPSEGTSNTVASLPFFSLPESSLLFTNHVLYGTTILGVGDSANGDVYKVNADGTGFTTIKGFTNIDEGSSLQDQQLAFSGNTLYGVATWGGLFECGTVFRVNTDGSGFKVLKQFTNTPDAANPIVGLTLTGSTLYGVTWHGGAFGAGAFFRINTDGTGYRILKSFSGTNDDGVKPSGIMVADNGILYGTGTGIDGDGVVFRLMPPPPDLEIKPTGSNVIVCWVDDGLAHSLETTMDPGLGNWTKVAGLNWTNGTDAVRFGLAITNSATPNGTFFRLR